MNNPAIPQTAANAVNPTLAALSIPINRPATAPTAGTPLETPHLSNGIESLLASLPTIEPGTPYNRFNVSKGAALAKTPVVFRHVTEAQALVVAKHYGVSTKTAWRYLQRGTLPAPRRLRGKDGKTYPAPGLREGHGDIWFELNNGKNCIRRADRKADTEGGLNQKELDQLAEAYAAIKDMYDAYRGHLATESTCPDPTATPQ